jgi:hypothetical protein
MKIFSSILSLLLLIPIFLKAQDQPDPEDRKNREKKMQALYVAYISRELILTEEEAQKFWPVHAQYDKELRSLDREMRELERDEAVLGIKKRYQDKFSKVLGNDRTDEFYRKDMEFRKRLMEKLQEQRERRGNRPGGGGAPGRMRGDREPKGPGPF